MALNNNAEQIKEALDNGEMDKAFQLMQEGTLSPEELEQVEKTKAACPVLPFDHPDCIEFDSLCKQLHELAEKNNWLLALSSIRPVTKDDNQGVDTNSAINLNGSALAVSFAGFGFGGILGADAYQQCIRNLHEFHKEILPRLNDK